MLAVSQTFHNFKRGIKIASKEMVVWEELNTFACAVVENMFYFLFIQIMHYCSSSHTDAQIPLPTFKFLGLQDLDVGVQHFHSFHAQSLG